MNRKNILFIFFFIITISCTRFKDIVYLRDIGTTPSDSLIKTTYSIYKVQPFDVLYIRIFSPTDEKADDYFNAGSQTQTGGGAYGVTSYYISGYTIDRDGKIKIPLIGEQYVAGLTIKEIEDTLRVQVKKYVIDGDVKVRLMSFKITLLGEIGCGQHTIYADRANLLEALALGGDINKSGNKHNVLIMRTTPEGIQTFRVDMTDKNIVKSPLFYVQPNDIIYVEPIKSAAWRISLSELSLFISTVTTLTSVYFLIKTLSK